MIDQEQCIIVTLRTYKGYKIKDIQNISLNIYFL